MLFGLVVAHPLVIAEAWRPIYYDVVATVAMTVAWWGIRYYRPVHRRAWRLVVIGFMGWVLGDVLYSVEQNIWHLAAYPAPSCSPWCGADARGGT